ncbi:hypothetical protein GMOD_00001544 [Pyrenophora seminiperda CCB06]|uniref:Uncharacterized protein n=1 Tax=Pyrenophora seminiperda CCB06 TaxID=1302712 RepID=A0A3M7LZG8_9PLEO|nr:hypothetical protein GMOD_00001544 [Pyrenophora seminiperda CCB06]
MPPRHPLIRGLDLPAELRSLLRVHKVQSVSCISMTHAALEAYFVVHPPVLDPTIPKSSQPVSEPTVFIDATIPTHNPEAWLDILPYIYLNVLYPHIKFRMRISPGKHQIMFQEFFDTHVHSKVNEWTEVLSHGCLQRVHAYIEDRTVDIVLKPGSSWANEWCCGSDTTEALELKQTLGLTGHMKGWQGYIVVASVEEI